LCWVKTIPSASFLDIEKAPEQHERLLYRCISFALLYHDPYDKAHNQYIKRLFGLTVILVGYGFYQGLLCCHAFAVCFCLNTNQRISLADTMVGIFENIGQSETNNIKR